MGRIRKSVDVEGHSRWALFDSGARNSYVTEDVAAQLPVFKLKKPEPVSLGGKVHNVVKDCRLECMIENLPIRTQARVLAEIGKDEDGKSIEVLIGALAMQEWGIRLIPQEEKLDLTHYSKEFVEY